jgi:hypothetical protein
MARPNNQRHGKQRPGVCGPHGALLALLVLAAQLVAPVLHTLGDKGARTPHHGHEVTTAGTAALDGGRAPCDRHHDAAACPVCQSLQRLRHSVVARPVVALAFDAPRLLHPTSGIFPASFPARAGTAPRAPPFLS